MKKIKKGDIVARKSYGKDIIFYVKRIIKTQKEEIAILCGLLERIEADSIIQDLEILDKTEINRKIEKQNEKIKNRIKQKDENYKIGIIERNEKRIGQKIVTGKILHLDRRQKIFTKII